MQTLQRNKSDSCKSMPKSVNRIGNNIIFNPILLSLFRIWQIPEWRRNDVSACGFT